ncbi:MAG: hypothetical protein ABGZ17_23450, partial [Planctomycetaceae bacterium]
MSNSAVRGWSAKRVTPEYRGPGRPAGRWEGACGRIVDGARGVDAQRGINGGDQIRADAGPCTVRKRPDRTPAIESIPCQFIRQD